MKHPVVRTIRRGVMEFERLPAPLRTAARRGYVRGIVQFGSSLHAARPSDIDLAVIVKKGAYERFRRLVDPRVFKGFDISLIRREEIGHPNAFRFGSHGPHLVLALREGRTLYGANPFRAASIGRKALRSSILLRLYDYLYDVRKAIFKKALPSGIVRRWPKFVRLCLFLLDEDLAYPSVLRMEEAEVTRRLRRHGWRKGNDAIANYERLWEIVLKEGKSSS